MDNVMFDYIPGFFRNAEKFKILLEAVNVQYDNVEDMIQDLIDQLYVDTATWGLVFWEKDRGLEYNPTLSYDERRSRIKAKIRGVGKVDRKLITTIAAAYSNGEVAVTFDGRININFIGTRGVPSAMVELMKQLEEITPSGLPIVYIFTYLIWNELDARNLTWDQLDALNLTWDQFETGGWL